MGLFDVFKRRKMHVEILRPEEVPVPLTNQLIDLKNEANEIKRLLREQDVKMASMDMNVSERLKQLETAITATKEAILERMQTNLTTIETHHTTDEKGKIKAMVDSLSIKEKKLFALLMQSGALSYQEIGDALKITPTTARGLVHRILIEPEKAVLFQKLQDDSGNVKVAIREEIENSILHSATQLVLNKTNSSGSQEQARENSNLPTPSQTQSNAK